MIYLYVLLFDSMSVAGCILTTYAGINIKLNASKSIIVDENKKIDYENMTVTYYRLSKEWGEQIVRTVMAICGILIASCPAVFSEYIPNIHIGIWGRLLLIPTITIILISVVYLLSKVIAYLFWELINRWAGRHGITQKIKEGQDVY